MGFHLLERFGYDDKFIETTAVVMEYGIQRQLMKTGRFVAG
jgi:hypothetical protein